MGIALEFRSWYNLRFDFPQSRTKECTMTRLHYDTDLTVLQWALLEPLLPPPKKTGRKPIDKRCLIFQFWDIKTLALGRYNVGYGSLPSYFT